MIVVEVMIVLVEDVIIYVEHVMGVDIYDGFL